MSIIVAILILLTVIGIVWKIVDLIFGKKIVIDFTRETIYGWYNAEILCSKCFSSNMTVEEIIKIQEELAKELEEKIIKYKKVNK